MKTFFKSLLATYICISVSLIFLCYTSGRNSSGVKIATFSNKNDAKQKNLLIRHHLKDMFDEDAYEGMFRDFFEKSSILKNKSSHHKRNKNVFMSSKPVNNFKSSGQTDFSEGNDSSDNHVSSKSICYVAGRCEENLNTVKSNGNSDQYYDFEDSGRNSYILNNDEVEEASEFDFDLSDNFSSTNISDGVQNELHDNFSLNAKPDCTDKLEFIHLRGNESNSFHEKIKNGKIKSLVLGRKMKKTVSCFASQTEAVRKKNIDCYRFPSFWNWKWFWIRGAEHVLPKCLCGTLPPQACDTSIADSKVSGNRKCSIHLPVLRFRINSIHRCDNTYRAKNNRSVLNFSVLEGKKWDKSSPRYAGESVISERKIMKNRSPSSSWEWKWFWDWGSEWTFPEFSSESVTHSLPDLYSETVPIRTTYIFSPFTSTFTEAPNTTSEFIPASDNVFGALSTSTNTSNNSAVPVTVKLICSGNSSEQTVSSVSEFTGVVSVVASSSSSRQCIVASSLELAELPNFAKDEALLSKHYKKIIDSNNNLFAAKTTSKFILVFDDSYNETHENTSRSLFVKTETPTDLNIVGGSKMALNIKSRDKTLNRKKKRKNGRPLKMKNTSDSMK